MLMLANKVTDDGTAGEGEGECECSCACECACACGKGEECLEEMEGEDDEES